MNNPAISLFRFECEFYFIDNGATKQIKCLSKREHTGRTEYEATRIALLRLYGRTTLMLFQEFLVFM